LCSPTAHPLNMLIKLVILFRGGFYLKIQPYRTTRANKGANFAPGIVEGFNRIYVGNLSWDITDDGLRKFFSDCKNHLYVSETGGFRGYGHVDFSNNASLMKALKLDQQIFCGRPIKVSCVVPKREQNSRESKAY